MTVQDQAEYFWEGIKKRAYYLIGFFVIILTPFIIQASNLPSIPILSNLYGIGRDINLFDTNSFVLRVLTLCAIYAIFAVSWDFLSGYTGQFNFGHAIFIGLSAYVGYWVGTGFAVTDIRIPNFFNGVLVIPTGILEPILSPQFVLDPVFALLFAALASALFAFVIGIVALRLKGYYLALLTLILPLVAIQLVTILEDLTGGDQGRVGVPHLLGIVEQSIRCGVNVDCIKEVNRLNFFILALFIMLISVGIMMVIAYSRIGLAFISIREDEEAAESLGINLTNYKVLAFVISAFFAGIAGVLFSQIEAVGTVGAGYFDSGVYSFRVIIMVIIGGVGTISGGLIGAFMLTLLLSLYVNPVFKEIVGMEILVFGLLLIISLRYLPYGIARAKSSEKRAIIFGILLSVSWAILPMSKPFDYLAVQSVENVLTFLALVVMLILTIPAIPVFIVSEFIGLFLLQGVMGLEITANLLIRAKFLIYIAVGIPYAYYLPKLFKLIRIKYWGIWPSVGQYEPE